MSEFANLAAIVLAAGFSRRMGGENKLLKPLGDRPLVAHGLETVSKLGLGQVIVVVGESAEALAPFLPANATSVRNPRSAEGMGTSLAAGAAALDASLAGAFVILGDMPLVKSEDYQRVAQAFHANGSSTICVPVHEGRRGHPVLFPSRYFPALAACEGDSGARHILSNPETPIREVGGCSPGILADFDDPASFAAYTAAHLPENGH